MARMTRQCWMVTVTMAVMLAGSTTTDTVMMQHPQTGEIAQCADGYRSLIDGRRHRRQEDCIADFERKGFERPR